MTGDDPHNESGPGEPRSPDDERVTALAEDPGREAEDAETLVALAEMTAERDEYLDALQRLQADFDNFRKRSMRQQTDLLEHATEGLCVRLLPVLDALDLATAHVRSQAEPSDSDKAIEQIDSLLRDILAREGVERIDAVGVPFDPTIHDAVGTLPSEPPPAAPVEHATSRGDTVKPAKPVKAAAHDDGPTVVQVMRAGYRLKSKVLRPAMVFVGG